MDSAIRFVSPVPQSSRLRIPGALNFKNEPRLPWPAIFVQCGRRDRSGKLSESHSARHVTELSLQGCFLETSASFELQRNVLVKIHDAGESFEADAVILYTRPSGLGLMFRDVKPRSRDLLQNWILKALDRQLDAQQIPS